MMHKTSFNLDCELSILASYNLPAFNPQQTKNTSSPEDKSNNQAISYSVIGLIISFKNNKLQFLFLILS